MEAHTSPRLLDFILRRLLVLAKFSLWTEGNLDGDIEETAEYEKALRGSL